LIDTDRAWRRREPAPAKDAPLRPADSRAMARWLPLGPVILLAGAGIAVLALTRFDGLYGQDSFAYFHYATGPLRQALARGQLPPPFFWPPGYPLLIAAMSGVVGVTPIAAQIVSVAAGAAVPAFTILLARELGTDETAGSPQARHRWLPVSLLAGLMVAVTGQLLQSSLVVMADTLGLAAATAGAWALARYRRTGALRWLLLCALAFAWAILTRWIYALVAVPAAIWGLTLLRGRSRGIALLRGAGAAVVGIVVLAPTVIPAVVGLMRGGNAPFAGDLQVYSWSPLNALQATFTTGDGQLVYRLPTGLYYALAPGTWWYFSPLLAALIAPGIWAVVRQKRIPAFGFLVAWAAIVLAFHAGAPWQNPRFALAYLPPLAILAAVGYDQLRRASHTQVRRAAAAWLVGGLALAAAGSAVLTQEFIERKQNDVAIVRWANGLAPLDGQLLAFGLTATFQEYGRLQTLDLSEVSTERIGALLGDGRPTLLLVDVNALERQWTGRAPWERYHALLAAPGLTPLGSRGGYTLFAVRHEGA
jgi:4-amino-4-deoxy-L-arabinose transferase-like glycosyltransferase